MKKLILFLSIIWTVSAFGQATVGFHRVNQLLQRGTSGTYAQIVPRGTVQVTSTATGLLATIYRDPLLTSQITSGSVTSDANGNYDYYVPLNYCVDETVSSPGAGSYTTTNICGNTGSAVALFATPPVLGSATPNVVNGTNGNFSGTVAAGAIVSPSAYFAGAVNTGGQIYCAPGPINACIATAEAYAHSANDGSDNAVEVYIPPGATITGGPITLISGMTLIGTAPPRYIDSAVSWGSGAAPNGGTWINCEGNPCFTAQTGTNGSSNINMRDLGFTNWTGHIFQVGGPNAVGMGYGKFDNIYAIGIPACCTSDQGFVFYNSQNIQINQMKINNVNTGLAYINNVTAGQVEGGNAEVTGFYTYTYAKSVANGNSTEPGILLQTGGTGFAVGMITLIRPQVNTYAGDGTSDGIELINAQAVTIIGGDFEGAVSGGGPSCLNSVHLVGSGYNTIFLDNAGGCTNGVNLDAGSNGNYFGGSAGAIQTVVSPIGGVATWTNSFAGNGYYPASGYAPLQIDSTCGLPLCAYKTAVLGQVFMPNGFTVSTSSVMPVTVSPNANDAVEIGTFTGGSSYGGTLFVSIYVLGGNGSSGMNIGKMYAIPWAYGCTTNYQKVIPLASSGTYMGNDFDLDVECSSSNPTDLSLWIVRTAGTSAGTASVWAQDVGIYSTASNRISDVDSMTPSTTVGTITAATAIYTPSESDDNVPRIPVTTYAPGSAAGTGGTITCDTVDGFTCTARSGVIKVAVGTSPSGSSLATLTWPTTTSIANCHVQGYGGVYGVSSHSLLPFVAGTSNASAAIWVVSTPAPATTYEFSYSCSY